MKTKNGWLFIAAMLCLGPAVTARGQDESAEATRTSRGLLALYDFAKIEKAVVRDVSGVGEPLDLKISDPQAVRPTAGALEVRRSTLIRSELPARKIIQAVSRWGAITIEAWVRPARTDQSGPARIVTLSDSANARNFTLGQDKAQFDIRFRTSKTNANGIPSLSSPARSLHTQLMHVVYTRERTGRARVYINGKQRREQTVAGSTANWRSDFHLALANEMGGDRPWLGSYHLVALYSRSLSSREVRKNFLAGAVVRETPEVAALHQQRLFEKRIAPLLVTHCFECHDAGSKKGGLDLSRKARALAGGESGPSIVAGKPAESLLWEQVAADEMPQDREPLSAEEKKWLREWIEQGAVWPAEVIDAALYAHDRRAGEIWVQRLTVDEYIETVRAAVGVDITREAHELLPPDLRADGFSNTAYNLSVDLKHVDAYARLAEIIVGRMDLLEFAGRFSKSRKLSTDDTMRELVAEMGKWLLRGPLDEREVTAYSGVATTVASAGGDFEEAVRYLVEALLQSPRFIYRIEAQRGDGSRWPVSDYELASRLSYILWGGPPDESLMKAADEGRLDAQGVQEQVARMLIDPRAIERSLQFVSEWLDLERLENMQPNAERFPQFSRDLASDMRDETLAFFREVAWTENRPLSELLNAQLTFASPRLAAHYGLPPQDPQEGRYDLSEVPGRGGLLTHASVLTVGGDEASMVSRGLFVLHDLLRGSIKGPPPCVDTTPVPTQAGLTQRDIAEARIADANCGVCHAKFEPLAFGLEKFDGLGGWHDRDEHGNVLREDGQILFPGSDQAVAYQTSAELMDLLAESARVRECITWKIVQFALGRPLVAEDAPVLAEIHATAQQNGGTYASVIAALVSSDLVQLTRTE